MKLAHAKKEGGARFPAGANKTFQYPLPPVTLPRTPHTACPLILAFRIVAVRTQRLHVGLRILTAFFQRRDVIALTRQPHSASTHAQTAQRLTPEQFRPQLLQLATRYPFCSCWLFCPSLSGMLGTSATAICHQCAAARMGAGFRCSSSHGNIPV